jgi:hypothetical protein
MKHSVKNFFNVINPQEYSCGIGSYRVNHSLMLIRATKSEFDPDQTFYLTFSGALYFEGPLGWKGANFCIGTTEECEKLLRKMDYSDDTLHILSEKYRLFVVELPSLEVKIVALDAGKSKDIPPNFPWLVKDIPMG